MLRNFFSVSISLYIIGNGVAGGGNDISFLGTLTVTHKLTRKTVLILPNVVINSNHSSGKVGMFLSSPLDACTAVDALPNDGTSLLSLAGSVEGRFAVLLVQDINCDTTHKLKHAHDAGYSGIILYSDKSNIWEFDMGPDTLGSGWFVALVSFSQGENLKKFAKNSYSLQFNREPTLTDKLHSKSLEIFQIFYEWGMAICDWFYQNYLYWKEIFLACLVFALQITVLSSSLVFLLVMVKRTKLEPATPDYEDYTFFFSSNGEEDGSWDWESNIHDESSGDEEESLTRYRSLLGVNADATRRDIETAFKRKSLELHPDKTIHLPAEERIRRTEQCKQLPGARIALLKSLERRQAS